MKSRGKNTPDPTLTVQLPRPNPSSISARPWLPACALALASVGCELGDNVQSLAEALANPTLKNVDAPGHLVAAGHYRGLSFDGNQTDGPFVVSVQDGANLSILRFPEGEGCDAGPVAAFMESLSYNDDPLNARIAMVAPATEDAPATLRFVNFECKASKLTVPGGTLPLSTDFVDRPGFIVQTAEGQVLFVNPWKNERTVVAQGAMPISDGKLALFAEGSAGALWMWTLEGGQVVARDKTLQEVFRAGQDVVTISHTSNAKLGPIVALQDATGALFTVLASDPATLNRVMNDACSAQFNPGLLGTELLYYSPCAERHLRVSELETGVVFDIRPGIVDYKVSGATETGPVLLYLTGPDVVGGSTSFWARWGQNEPILLGENGHLGMSRITGQGEARVVLDWNGSVGDLLVGPLGEGLDKRASSVAYNAAAGVISNFDGSNGTLQRFTDTGKLELVTKNVSPRGIRNDPYRDRTLFLLDFDGSEGRLVLIEANELRTMSKQVRPNAYQFTQQEERVTLLSDLDGETSTATLKLPTTQYEDEGIISAGVAESLEVNWPSKGLLYSAPAAKEPGIYFARFY